MRKGRERTGKEKYNGNIESDKTARDHQDEMKERK